MVKVYLFYKICQRAKWSEYSVLQRKFDTEYSLSSESGLELEQQSG